MPNIILTIIGVFLIFIGLVTTTHGVLSKIILKVLPLLSGVFCIIYGLSLMGVISLNI